MWWKQSVFHLSPPVCHSINITWLESFHISQKMLTQLFCCYNPCWSAVTFSLWWLILAPVCWHRFQIWWLLMTLHSWLWKRRFDSKSSFSDLTFLHLQIKFSIIFHYLYSVPPEPQPVMTRQGLVSVSASSSLRCLMVPGGRSRSVHIRFSSWRVFFRLVFILSWRFWGRGIISYQCVIVMKGFLTRCLQACFHQSCWFVKLKMKVLLFILLH